MSENNQLPTSEPRTVKDYLALPAYKDRFAEVLGKRAPQFLAAITAVSQMESLRNANPRSVIAAAMVSATLDLPVNPALGQSYIVAYGGEAQFQIGFKGLIQLALRSAQYKRMNAGPVNAEVFAGYDAVGEPSLDWSKFDPLKEVGGYFCAFELVNGFTKVVYWSKPQVEAHARRFSKAYAKGYATPWKSDFDAMATKTVIKNALTKWGMLSVEMQKAVVHDQGAQADVDSDVNYIDADERMEGDPAPTPDRPAPKARAAKGVKAAQEVIVPQEEQMHPDSASGNPSTGNATQASLASEPSKAATKDAPKPATATEILAEADAKAAKMRQDEADAKAKRAEDEKAAITPAPEVDTRSNATTQRALLHDGEVITVEAQIDAFKLVTGTRSGQPWPYVTADIVSPELRGQVSMTDGAVIDGQPIPAWQLDQPVRLTVRGKKYKNGSLVNVVEKIEVIGGALGDTGADSDV